MSLFDRIFAYSVIMKLSTTKGVPLVKCNVQMLLESETFPGILCFISFPVIPTKIATSRNFLTVSHQISIYKSCDQRFWKVPRQTNGYVLNKCPLNSPCAYLNTQGSSPCGTPLILIDDS
ncbi:hypothetical protein T02_3023 [Trichinella nativa]|uniref:Uncharacterized protein n=1 Tax=Trichinella nativa TaxID=6335 RepID=A0A0V1L7V1_9BILA|nr:hypothetical protein T02_3023 [Trichinella nativa]